MNEIEESVRVILSAIGEDPEREGLQKTPERVGRMYRELCAGYEMDLNTLVNGAVFHSENTDMVLVKDITFYSLCEHHMLPFFGKAHAAYIPDGKVIGLSKIPRIVEMYARRLQIQEQLTVQIADALETVLHPKGIAVYLEGKHLCSMMRGVKKEAAELRTQKYTGCFEENSELRREFLMQILNGNASRQNERPTEP